MFPDAGWEMRTRNNVSPQFSKNLDRFTQFLTLVGLTSLIIGGVGVANAIRAFVERERATIATLKSLGAGGATAFAILLTEVMLIACLGVALGAILGAALPYLGAFAFGALLPFPLVPSIHPGAIGEGALYGLLTALAFSIAPLGRAHDIPAQAIFRAGVEPLGAWPRPRYVLMTLAAALALVAAALALSSDRKLALIYLGGTIAAFALLRLVALLIMMLARRLPHPRQRRPAPRDRQYSPAGGLDPFRRAFARPRPRASRRAGADRRQYSRRTEIERRGRGAELLLSRCPSSEGRCVRTISSRRVRRTARWILCRCCAGASSG